MFTKCDKLARLVILRQNFASKLCRAPATCEHSEEKIKFKSQIFGVKMNLGLVTYKRDSS
jgi:uncharacterized lipoprotein YehR (DUF1307 family)